MRSSVGKLCMAILDHKVYNQSRKIMHMRAYTVSPYLANEERRVGPRAAAVGLLCAAS